jgi:cysteine desulfurase/selenocysteine lyase
MPGAPTRPLDPTRLANDFPILSRPMRGKPLVYLDNGATSQKPELVIRAMDDYNRRSNANIHRGVYLLSQEATSLYDEARVKAQTLLNAADSAEVIFTKGCTESINLVADAWGRANIEPGDFVLVSVMEHHSNIVPWQLIGAQTIPIPMDDLGVLDLAAYEALLKAHRVKLVAITHVSNVLGTVNPIRQISDLAHANGALVLVDGAQAAPHHLIDVQALDADFYAVAGHKMYGPMGIGLLYGKRALLEAMNPYQGGGDMIHTVSFDRTTFAELPAKFEAGTPNVTAAHGLGAAVDYIAGVGGDEGSLRERLQRSYEQIEAHEQALLATAQEQLSQIDGLTIQGRAPGKSAIVSFTLENAHPHDIATILDADGIAVRAGHHCCMPLMKRLGVSATARASFGLYNMPNEIPALVHSVEKVRELFK